MCWFLKLDCDLVVSVLRTHTCSRVSGFTASELTPHCHRYCLQLWGYKVRGIVKAQRMPQAKEVKKLAVKAIEYL